MKYILCIALLLISISAEAQNLDCEKFKEGRFLTLDGNKNDVRITIVRSADKQMEYHETTGIKVELKIIWTSTCSYYLKYVSSTDDVSNHFPDRKLFIDIIEVQGNLYKYKAHLEDLEGVPPVIGWIKKIKG